MKTEWLDSVDASWSEFLDVQAANLDSIYERVIRKSSGKNYLPQPNQVLRCLSMPVESVKVVIVGQDPYPNSRHACGLAFAIGKSSEPLPKSLTNIRTEIISDLNCEGGGSLDLSRWHKSGVMLLNRVLTVNENDSNSHANIGWEEFTLEILKYLDSSQKIVAILWGNTAMKIEPYLFNAEVLKSAHPSPLSAHRGFFGSRPFSNANRLLVQAEIEPIDWCSAFSNA
jgi:uracil-DNA glycosylase